MKRFLVGLTLSLIAIVSSIIPNSKPATAATCYAGFTYSGYVLHKSYSWLYLWNPSTGCENWVSSSRAWTCDPYEWFNGYTCPTGGGGGGGSW